MAILIIAEHDNTQLKISTLNTITAAQKIATDITVLIAGKNCNSVAKEAATIENISKVLISDVNIFEHFLAEPFAALVSQLASNYSHVLTPATTFGKNFLPRAAALQNSAMISDIIAIENPETFVRPIYAGNALATIQSNDKIKFITIRPTAFIAAKIGANIAPIENINFSYSDQLSSFLKYEATVSSRPELTNAKVIVSGGRGLQNKENFKLIEQLADALGAAIGASRAAVDAGYVPNDYQVGQTGKVVAPALYIAVGISGAIQHIAGIKDSKVIVAINKDPDAPIFQIADYGLVGDLFEIIPALIEILQK